jgi:hypothetical protein
MAGAVDADEADEADEAASIVPLASARTTGISSLLSQGRAACDQI